MTLRQEFDGAFEVVTFCLIVLILLFTCLGLASVARMVVDGYGDQKPDGTSESIPHASVARPGKVDMPRPSPPQLPRRMQQQLSLCPDLLVPEGYQAVLHIPCLSSVVLVAPGNELEFQIFDEKRAPILGLRAQWSLLAGFSTSDLRDPSPSQILGISSRFSETFLAERERGGSLGDPPGP